MPIPSELDTSPDKAYFVRSATRDIHTRDALFDLIDNSADAALRQVRIQGEIYGDSDRPIDLSGYVIEIKIDKAAIKLKDNCGGISEDRIENFFRSGKSYQDPFSIGAFGIGLKRALFKLGNVATFSSSLAGESFSFSINADKYLASPSWNVPIHKDSTNLFDGTIITIEELHEEALDDLFDRKNPKSKKKLGALINEIARIYHVFLGKGLKIVVNDLPVPKWGFMIRRDGPFCLQGSETHDGGAVVEWTAGLHTRLRTVVDKAIDGRPIGPISLTGDRLEKRDPFVADYGWWIICNDRVVLAGDKSELTGWGIEAYGRGVGKWHSEYHGFVGIIRMHCKDSTLLPWTTEKRGVNKQSSLYKKYIEIMIDAAKSWTSLVSRSKVGRLDLNTSRLEIRPDEDAGRSAPGATEYSVSENDLFKQADQTANETNAGSQQGKHAPHDYGDAAHQQTGANEEAPLEKKLGNDTVSDGRQSKEVEAQDEQADDDQPERDGSDSHAGPRQAGASEEAPPEKQPGDNIVSGGGQGNGSEHRERQADNRQAGPGGSDSRAGPEQSHNPGANGTRGTKRDTRSTWERSKQLIPPGVNASKNSSSKLVSILSEAKAITVESRTRYTAAAIFRCVFEQSLVNYLKRTGKWRDLKKSYVDSMRKKSERLFCDKPDCKNHQRDTGKNGDNVNYEPPLEYCVDHIISNPNLLCSHSPKALIRALSEFRAEKDKLNGAIHSDETPLDLGELERIRINSAPILEYFLQSSV